MSNKVQYLEIVTPEVEEVCAAFVKSQDVSFSEPVAMLGNARTADMPDGSKLGVRAPMHETELPIVRPYFLVEDIEAAVNAVEESGAMIAHPPLNLDGIGTFAIYIQGGVQFGLWQN